MRLAIIGGRDFSDYGLLCAVMAKVRTPLTEVVSGAAAGADRLGARWGREHGVWVRELVPLWAMHGKKAGFLRNSDIIETSDAVLAFWDGVSSGTRDSIHKARQHGLVVHVVNY